MSSTSKPTTRRSTRAIKKSERARNSDGPVPGIDSTLRLAAQSSSLPSYEKSDNLARQALSRSIRTTNKSTDSIGTLLLEQATDALQAHTLSYDEPDTFHKTSATQPTGSEQTAMPTPPDTPAIPNRPSSVKGPQPARHPQRHARDRRKSNKDPPDYLESIKLPIYDWPSPRPSDYTRLSDWHKSLKSAQDKQDAADDKDQWLDDWHEKCGRAEAYELVDGASLNYSIARTFILRAKRAFWARRTWQDFEDEEIRIDTISQARHQSNPKLQRIMLEEAVDNGLRLRIFHSIKKRLREEIWSQSYDSQSVTSA